MAESHYVYIRFLSKASQTHNRIEHILQHTDGELRRLCTLLPMWLAGVHVYRSGDECEPFPAHLITNSVYRLAAAYEATFTSYGFDIERVMNLERGRELSAALDSYADKQIHMIDIIADVRERGPDEPVGPRADVILNMSQFVAGLENDLFVHTRIFAGTPDIVLNNLILYVPNFVHRMWS